MKLFYSPGACALSVQIILREAGYSFDLIKVNLKTKESEVGDFRKINPKGYVPVLQLDSGEVFTENAVILQWIADQKTEMKLFPKFGTVERYPAMEWLNFISTELHKGISSLFSPFDDQGKKVIMTKLQVRLAFLEKHLSQNKYVLGSEFSIADAYLYNVMRWAKVVNIDMSEQKSILDFMERMLKRPSVVESVAAEGLALS